MVPPNFTLKDSPEVQEFRRLDGAWRVPLLVEESTDRRSVFDLQGRLKRALEANELFVTEHYSRDAARNRYHSDANFQMFETKAMGELADYLRQKNLVWHSRELVGGNYDKDWLSLHPLLSEAIMSLIAIATATDEGLDIVTSSGSVHHALTVPDENEVINKLVGVETLRLKPSSEEMADELAEMVLTTCFDLRQLTPKQIAELNKEGKDLRKFKSALIPIAQSVPDIRDLEERQKRMRAKAEEVLDLWMEYRNSLPRFALDALVDLSDIKVPEVAVGVAAGAVGLALGHGLAIWIIVWKALGVGRKFKEQWGNPYRFLSRIEKSGGLVNGAAPQTPVLSMLARFRAADD